MFGPTTIRSLLDKIVLTIGLKGFIKVSKTSVLEIFRNFNFTSSYDSYEHNQK